LHAENKGEHRYGEGQQGQKPNSQTASLSAQATLVNIEADQAGDQGEQKDWQEQKQGRDGQEAQQ